MCGCDHYIQADAETVAALSNLNDSARLAACLEKERERRLAAESKAFALLLSFSRTAKDRDQMTERIANERTKGRAEAERARAEAAAARAAAAAAEVRLRDTATKLLLTKRGDDTDANPGGASAPTTNASASKLVSLPRAVEEALQAVHSALADGATVEARASCAQIAQMAQFAADHAEARVALSAADREERDIAHRIYKLRQELSTARGAYDMLEGNRGKAGGGVRATGGGKREATRIAGLKEKLAEAKEAQAAVRALRLSAAPPPTSTAQRYMPDNAVGGAGDGAETERPRANWERDVSEADLGGIIQRAAQTDDDALAVMALEELASLTSPRDAAEMRDRVVGAGGVPPLVAALTIRRGGGGATTNRAHEAAATTLAHLARTKELRGVISRAGALPPLLGIALAPLATPTAGADGHGGEAGEVAGAAAAQEAAQTAIINLVNGSDANRSLTVGAGALERLADSLAAGEMTPERERTRNAVILLRSLVFKSESNRDRFPEQGVAPLVGLLDVGNDRIVTNAAWCVGSLGTVPRHHAAIRAAGGIAKLLDLAVGSNRRSVAHAAVSALANLVASDDNFECVVELIRLRASRPLTQLVASDDVAISKAAGKVMRALGAVHSVDMRAALAALESALAAHDVTTAITAWRQLENHTRGAGTLLEEVVVGEQEFGPSRMSRGGVNMEAFAVGAPSFKVLEPEDRGGGGVNPTNPASPLPLSPTAVAERNRQMENEIS